MDSRELLQHGYRYAYALTRKAHDAEDLVQEAWVKLMAAKGHVDSMSLLIVTIRNLYIDQYRRNNLIVFDSLEVSAEPISPEKLEQSVGNRRDLENALEQLRSEENETILLNVVMGYTAEEIAEITDKSRNTVLSLISRGKKKLAKILSAADLKVDNVL